MRAALLSAAAAAVLLVVTGCGAASRAAEPPATTDGRLIGLTPATLPRKPAIVLTDTSGKHYSLTAETRGKLTYLYFGYTNCPDACPLTMGTIAAAVHRQPAALRKQVAVVFVTVDPKRDTPDVLRQWLDNYDMSFVGLTGTEAQVRAAEEAAGVPPAPRGTLNHSTLVLAYSPDNLSHVVYSSGFTARDYAHDIPLLLRYR